MSLLASDVEGDPAGGQHREPGARSQYIRQPWGGRRNHLLHVVEHEQEVPRLQPGGQQFGNGQGAALLNAQRLRHREGHEVVVPDRGERDEAGTVREIVTRPPHDFQREAGLAHPARTQQGQEPQVVTVELAKDSLDLLVAAEDWIQDGWNGTRRTGHCGT
ncbi:MAG: hypothetical protein M3457_09525 [Chloroflexota bacterium]|nr:hypothetical protein [Chloroflexota bacterium]